MGRGDQLFRIGALLILEPSFERIQGIGEHAGIGGQMTVARASGAKPDRFRLADHVTSPLVMCSIAFGLRTITLFKRAGHVRRIHHTGQCKSRTALSRLRQAEARIRMARTRADWRMIVPEWLLSRRQSNDGGCATAVPGEIFELPTNGLQNRCSTTELTRPLC